MPASRWVFSPNISLIGLRPSTWLQLRALRFACHTHPVLQREVCRGNSEGQLKRGDFGASFGMPFVEYRVRLRVQVECIRQ